jgi:hypothetical protein
MESTGTYGQAAQQPKELSLTDVVSATSSEMDGLRARIYDLEIRLGRYDRAFERMFAEEIETRLGSKNRLHEVDKACDVSPLQGLSYKLRRGL